LDRKLGLVGVKARLNGVRRHMGKGAGCLIPTFLSKDMDERKGKQIEEFRTDLFERQYLDRVQGFRKVSPSDACVVGDTKYDGQAAREAGIPFIGVLCGGSSADELERAGAISIYRDPADLLPNWSRWRDLISRREFAAAALS